MRCPRKALAEFVLWITRHAPGFSAAEAGAEKVKGAIASVATRAVLYRIVVFLPVCRREIWLERLSASRNSRASTFNARRWQTREPGERMIASERRGQFVSHVVAGALRQAGNCVCAVEQGHIGLVEMASI